MIKYLSIYVLKKSEKMQLNVCQNNLNVTIYILICIKNIITLLIILQNFKKILRTHHSFLFDHKSTDTTKPEPYLQKYTIDVQLTCDRIQNEFVYLLQVDFVNGIIFSS